MNDMDKYLQSCGPIKMKQKEKKKFVIKGSSAAKAAEGAEEKPAAVVPEEEEDNSADSRRGCKLFALIGIGSLLLIGLVTGGIFGYLHYKNAAQKKADYARIEQEEGKTRTNIAKFVTVAREYVKKLEAFPAEADGYVKTAADLAAGVLGEEVRQQFAAAPLADLPLPPVFAKVDAAFSGKKDEPADEEKAAAPAGTNAAATAAADTAKPADVDAMAKAFEAKLLDALKKKGLKPEEIEKTFTEMAAGKLAAPPEKLMKDLTEVLTGLQSELLPLLQASTGGVDGKGDGKTTIPPQLQKLFGGMTDGKDAGKSPFPAALQVLLMPQQGTNAVPVGTAPAAEAAPAEPEPETPPAVKLVKGMSDDAAHVARACRLAKAMLAKIEEHARFAEKFEEVTDEHLDQLVQLNNFLKQEVDCLSFEKAIAEIPRRCNSLKKTVDSVKAELDSLLALQKQQKLEAEKKAKAAADAEKKRQEAEALKAKTEAECKKVAETETAAAVALRSLDFRQATRTVRDIREELETDGGQTECLLALERIKRFENFHKYLSTQAAGYKSVKGWTISASDAKTLTVGGSRITWKTVYNERMTIFAELVLHFVAPEQTKKLHLRERSRLKTNAALALQLFYPQNPSAMKLARKLANEAAEQFESDADDIKALVPKFFEDDPAPAAATE